ncbi:hypothetical protein QBC46DRAFT_315368 [Diplogelasinospora grovesii]|uniref:Calcineurin-like phosphoesterase domain-containing protein n=1 Tax=Diplogelasinospora grovesii TaxID=303347 RepID=A0AAN6S4H8_9PEZI|nr:hypothetical protein QBC46DRAFT_315368 [Diplogelasinospora grovesii]
MAPSNGNQYHSHGHHGGHYQQQQLPAWPYPDPNSTSLFEDLRTLTAQGVRRLWRFWNERGRHMVVAAMVFSARRLRQNLAWHRLFSFPHLLVAFWVVLLLWGERWVFHSKVEKCRWSNWEQWPAGANPHHLILVADPQLIDPHSYPGRPWPINPLIVLITDNYLRRSYNQLQWQLNPETIFFLGDLFDGGREWKTAHGEFKDPEWGPHPTNEQKYLKSWNRKYGEDFWLREYARFGDIFFSPWVEAGRRPENAQKRRKLIASLPGNHDLGFGAEIKIPVRDRFEAYFGEGNRVDVIGNHTFVSVDTVSLSARSSDVSGGYDLSNIYKPTEHFLDDVQWTKGKAVEKELRFMRGEVPEVKFEHRIEDLDKADFKNRPTLPEGAPELPTILLTHVPLYRPPGTPCGPLREHWPPTKPPKGQEGPVIPDDRNAISVTRGYQYQNVLNEDDSVMLVKKVGNVVHAFSGDDHDYCELKHAANQGNVPEITVKSISMAMGVPTPAFLMVSMYNPIGADGKPLLGAGKPTLQTHLCLLPTQDKTYFRYIGFALLCLAVLAVRAVLVPVLKLTPFALDPEPNSNFTILPVFKAKVEDYDEYALGPAGGSSASSRYGTNSGTRDRSGSFTPSVRANGLASQARNAIPLASPKASYKRSHHGRAKSSGTGKWGWGGQSRAPRIEIKTDSDDDQSYNGGKWKPASRSRSNSKTSLVLREFWTTAYRVAWMAVLFFAWLAYKG